MEIAEEDVYHYQVDGVSFTGLRDEAIYKYFHGGVPIEEIARVRGCSVSRIHTLVKRQKDAYHLQAYGARIQQQKQFDKAMVKLDPTGNSAVTMAYLQPLRGFLQAVAYDK
jgi:DNA-directed RNA polymerase specialized sigma24 family protein